LIQAQTVMDSLNRYLHPPGGIVLTGSILQQQYDQQWRGEATVILFDRREIGLLTENEYVLVNQDTIWTYNFESHQVLIDSYSWDQFNLFELLSGDFSQVNLGQIDHSQGRLTQSFSIPDMGITGQLTLLIPSYRPEHLRVNYDVNNRVEIDLETATYPAQSPELTKGRPWDVIDLRE